MVRQTYESLVSAKINFRFGKCIEIIFIFSVVSNDGVVHETIRCEDDFFKDCTMNGGNGHSCYVSFWTFFVSCFLVKSVKLKKKLFHIKCEVKKK